MADFRKDRLTEKYEEAAFELLLDEFAERAGAVLLQEYEEFEKDSDADDVSDDLDQICLDTIDTAFAVQQGSKRKRQAVRFLQRAAVLILALLAVSIASVFSVEALRVQVLNFLIRHSEKYTTFYFASDENSVTFQQYTDYLVELIDEELPSDYELADSSVLNDGFVIISFQNQNNGIVIFSRETSGGNMKVDTENTEILETAVGDHDAMLIEKNGAQLIWFNQNDGFMYCLQSSEVDSDSLIELAEKIADVSFTVRK